MALATQCPHCHTTFRVASDQLKLRGGIVRCGACQSIFDGNAHLIDLDALAASKAGGAPAPAPSPATAPAAQPAPEGAAPASAPLPTDDEHGAQPQDDVAEALPVYTLDFDHTFDPLGILPKPAPEEPAAAPVPAFTPISTPATAPRAQVWRNGGSMAAARLVPEPEPETEPAPAPGTIPEEEAAPVVEPEPAPEPAPEAETAVPEEPAMEADVTPEAAETAPAAIAEPVPAEAPAEAAPLPAASAYAPQGRIEPSFELPVDEELVARPLPGDEDADADEAPAAPAMTATTSTPPDDTPSAALPLRASAAGVDTLMPPSAPAPGPAVKSARTKAVEARTRRSRLTPTRIDAPKLRVPASLEPDEPEFVKRSRKQEESGRSWRLLMIGGAVVLALLLAAQLVLDFRNVLAARYPGARPLLGSACAVLGCRVGLPSQVENLSIETGELTTLGVDTYSLNTLLRNQGGLAQAWPSIQLELTDANDKPLLRRVFGPADYLPKGVPVAAGFAARSEQPVRLNFALTDLKPSGYHMIVFYP
jgi:predicted Zn finger-like uncharacterized protein